jgi:predicted N-acetyltransferase YhbS
MASPLDDPRFTLVPSGRFRERFGPLGRDASFSDRKLCLVATDPVFLVELLYGISLRQDCFYVKYGMIAREGMILGRVSLATDEAVSELCQQLKGHPSLMVSLQDDAWFNSFREPEVPAGSCGVWDDWVEHEAEVASVVEAAFGGNDETKIIAALRTARAATISLTAQIPPPQGGRDPWPIVGHIVLSPVTIDANREPRGLGLAPLAVALAHQRKGFGGQLVLAGLHRARLLGYAYVVVLGSADYYSRFGFVPASQFALSYPEAALQPHFMALELATGSLAEVSGTVRYHAAFSTGLSD